MDKQQRLYNEAMANLAEAQNCQTEIVNCNNELRNIYSTRTYDWPSYYHLMEQSNEVIRRQYDWIKKRDDKLNDALSDALDIANDEMDHHTFNISSLGSQALGYVCVFMVSNNIRIQYSTEVLVKLAKVAAKEMDKFLFDIRKFGW